MFSSSLHTALSEDTTLAALLDTYQSRPAVFADMAPENADKPYVVFRIIKSAANSISVDEFSVFIDYFERGTSKKNMKAAAFAIETLLDQKSLTHARFSNIRFSRFSAGPVPTMDPRDIHYNIQFMARAGRSGWMQTL